MATSSASAGGQIICYGVVFESALTSYGAYVPDSPGCVAVGETLEEVRQLIVEAIQFRIEGLLEEGLPIPESKSVLEYIKV